MTKVEITLTTQEAMEIAEWNNIKVRLPEPPESYLWNYPPCYPPLIEGQNYSENVLAEVEGYTDLQVMCYIYVEGEEGGFMWATCNKTLDGDAEFDDNYVVIKWQYIPKI